MPPTKTTNPVPGIPFNGGETRGRALRATQKSQLHETPQRSRFIDGLLKNFGQRDESAAALEEEIEE